MEVAERKGSTEFEYPVSQLIKDRRSRRAYANKPIELTKINSLFEAARWAPSSMNEQPWTYIYATKSGQPDLWNRMFNVLNERNQIWTTDVPLLVMSLARKNFTVNDRPNGTAKYDMGAANAFLTLQATELGLNVHQMGGFDQLRARTSLNIPDTYDIGVIMAIGYPGNPDELPENLKEREFAARQRWTQEEFVRNQVF